MRPPSIIWFERLYLGAIAIGFIDLFVSWEDTRRLVTENPDTAALGTDTVTAIAIATIAASYLISLLLWYFTARRGSVVAKWIMVVFFGIGLLSLRNAIAQGVFIGINDLLIAAAWILQAVAIFMLFRPDSNAWFKGEWQDASIAERFE